MSKILLVEDMKSVRETLAMALERSGHDVVTADHGEAGIGLLEDGGFDFVVTDIIMPKRDGVDVIYSAKQKGIKVLAISGGGATISAEQALAVAQATADAVLSKPFSTSELNDAVQQLVDQ